MLKTYKHIVNNINKCNFVLNLNLNVMIKKLLFIFITVFAFAEINAQEHVVVSTSGCVTNPDSIAEFIQVADVNGKDAFQVVQTGEGLSTWATTNFPGVAESPLDFHIEFTSGTNRWEVIIVDLGNLVAFYQDTDISGTLIPGSGWISTETACVAGTVITIIAENSGVLDVEKESLNSKISIYPNPSSDFISITNIVGATPIRITNITGQTVISTVVDVNNNQVDIKELSKGFYFVEIKGKKTIKLIKK